MEKAPLVLKQNPGGVGFTRDQWVWCRQFVNSLNPPDYAYQVGYLGDTAGQIYDNIADPNVRMGRADSTVKRMVKARSNEIHDKLQAGCAFDIRGVSATPQPTPEGRVWQIAAAMNDDNIIDVQAPAVHPTQPTPEQLDAVEDTFMLVFAALHNWQNGFRVMPGLLAPKVDLPPSFPLNIELTPAAVESSPGGVCGQATCGCQDASDPADRTRPDPPFTPDGPRPALSKPMVIPPSRTGFEALWESVIADWVDGPDAFALRDAIHAVLSDEQMGEVLKKFDERKQEHMLLDEMT